jgi:hypothetical protein
MDCRKEIIMNGWQAQLRNFVQAMGPKSDRELIELASKQFKTMLVDIREVIEALNELRDTLQGAINDAEQAVKVVK